MKTKRALLDLIRDCAQHLGPTAGPPLRARIAEALGPPKEMAQSEIRMRLADIASAIDERLPESHGFIVLIFDFGDSGMLNYTANCRREDAINVLKEFLLKAGASEDWMQHIK